MPYSGYQDWERVNLASGYQLVNVNEAFAANTNLGAGNVQAWPFINFSMITPYGSDAYTINFVWTTNATYTSVIFEQSFTVQSECYTAFSIPVLGPFLQIQVQPQAGGNATAVALTAYGAAQYASPFSFGLFDAPLISISIPFTASQVNTYYVYHTYPGSALLTCDSSVSQTMSVESDYYDIGSNAWYRYYKASGNFSTNPLAFVIPLPGTQVRIAITNGAAGANINAALTAIP